MSRPRFWNVALTGMNARPDNPGPGAAVARCLRQAPDFAGRLVGLGYDVMDPGLHHGGQVDSAYLLPYPTSGPEALLERLVEIHEQERLDAVIPCLDSELRSFQTLAPDLERLGIRTFLPSRAALRARSKDALPTLCARAGVATPETVLISNPGFFEDGGWDYPLVVKGPFYDAEVCYTPVQARAAWARMAQQWGYPVLAQRFVEGQEYNLTGLGDGEGGLLAPVMMRKQALTEKGKAWAGIAIDDGELEEMARRLLVELRWRGPLEVEALRATDGTLHLVEINPRFPAWIYLSHGVGRNLPAMLLRLMAGETAFDLPAPRPGTMFIRFADEILLDLAAFESLTMTGARELNPMAARLHAA